MAQAGSIPTTFLMSPAVPAAAIRNEKLRLEAVTGDGMSPRFKPGDFALVKPTTVFEGDGTYVVEGPFGGEIFNAQSFIGWSRIRLWRENKAYTDEVLSLEEFEERVLAIVAADIRVTDERPLRSAIDNRRSSGLEDA